MSEFTISVHIDAPPSAVFAYIADEHRTPEWYEAVRSARKMTPGPTEKGTIFEFVRRLPQGEVVNEVEITEFEEPRRIAFASKRGPTPFVYRYLIEPAPGGAMLVLNASITGEGLRGPAALLAPVAGRFFGKGMARNLQALKVRLER